jgi:DNA-directed RNA polymerase subunit RPC12/RpoP
MSSSYRILKTYDFLHQADLDLIQLRDEGLDVYKTDSNTVNLVPFYSNAVGGIKIYVAEEDWERAREILSNETTHENDLRELFPDENIEPVMRCPNCHSTNIFQERSILSGLFFLITFFLPVSLPKNKYHCVRCDHTWKR